MKEETILEIEGHKIKVLVARERFPEKYKAVVSFVDFPDSPAIHSASDREVAIKAAIKKLFEHGDPEVLKLI